MTPLAFIGVLHGCFVFGTLIVVIPYYSRKPEFKHVTFVIASYMLLTFCSIHTVGRLDVPAWKLIAIGAAWVIGDFSMWSLISEGRNRRDTFRK